MPLSDTDISALLQTAMACSDTTREQVDYLLGIAASYRFRRDRRAGLDSDFRAGHLSQGEASRLSGVSRSTIQRRFPPVQRFGLETEHYIPGDAVFDLMRERHASDPRPVQAATARAWQAFAEAPSFATAKVWVAARRSIIAARKARWA